MRAQRAGHAEKVAGHGSGARTQPCAQQPPGGTPGGRTAGARPPRGAANSAAVNPAIKRCCYCIVCQGRLATQPPAATALLPAAAGAERVSVPAPGCFDDGCAAKHMGPSGLMRWRHSKGGGGSKPGGLAVFGTRPVQRAPVQVRLSPLESPCGSSRSFKTGPGRRCRQPR